MPPSSYAAAQTVVFSGKTGAACVRPPREEGEAGFGAAAAAVALPGGQEGSSGGSSSKAFDPGCCSRPNCENETKVKKEEQPQSPRPKKETQESRGSKNWEKQGVAVQGLQKMAGEEGGLPPELIERDQTWPVLFSTGAFSGQQLRKTSAKLANVIRDPINSVKGCDHGEPLRPEDPTPNDVAAAQQRGQP